MSQEVKKWDVEKRYKCEIMKEASQLLFGIHGTKCIYHQFISNDCKKGEEPDCSNCWVYKRWKEKKEE